MIHKVSYAGKLSPRSKCFSAPITVGVVMDSGEYLGTSIPTIRRYYLSSYEETVMCKSCGYGDPKYSRSQSQRYRVYAPADPLRRMAPDKLETQEDFIEFIIILRP